MRRWLAAAIVVGSVTLPAAAQAPAAPSGTDAVLDQAATYLASFVDRFSKVVVDEDYVQQFELPAWVVQREDRQRSGPFKPEPEKRHLKSEFLLAKLADADDWFAFRDVFEVDGRKVRSHDDRLAALFANPPPNALDRAAVLASEGARYAYGGTTRTLGNPLFALALLQRRYQSHFRYAVRPAERGAPAGTVEVEFEEVQRPTLIRDVESAQRDKDVVARGRYSISSEDGRVMRTELHAGDDVVTVLFHWSDEFGIAVPSEMIESFKSGLGHVDGRATYGRFRRFGVTTEEQIR